MEIKEEDHQFVLYDGEEYVGEVDWDDFEGDIEIVRTFVRPEYGHRGLAAQLVQIMVDKAEKEGKKISPTCSYAAAQFEKHGEYLPVLSDKTHPRGGSTGSDNAVCEIPTRME